MKQNLESGKKKLATRSFSFILALVFVFSIFSGTVSVGKIQEENNNNTTLTVTLETAPPNITSFAPPSPVYDTVCNLRTFNITVNQTVNVSWYRNESFLFTNESVTEASCTLHAEVIGKHNVSAIASNPSGTDMQTWIWNVLPTPTPTPALSTNVTETTDATYINITAGEAKQMMGENRSLVILDVRPFAEYKSGHIEGAESLPLSNMSCGTCLHASLDKNRGKTLLVYCRSGIKSEDACNILVSYEFETVYNMMGGLNAWEDAGFPVVSDSNDSFSSEIDDTLSSNKSVFLFLYVDWCHFCQQQMPIIDELEQEYAENITFFHVDCEEHPEAAREFGVNGFPAMFLIMGKGEDGQYESQYFRGFIDKETLKRSIDWIIANGSINENSKDNELGIGASPTLLIDDDDYTVALAGAASCPSSPPGVAPRDPRIASGALCRGACGGDCPSTCRALPDISICASDGKHICKYRVIECGSHQGCREHDACYDNCAAYSSDPPLCRRGCDTFCIENYGVITCARWASGHGPYDSWLKFSYSPVQTACEEPTPYCIDGKCVECRTNADCDDDDGWYPNGANAEEYRNYYCSDDKECIYDITNHRCNDGYHNCDGDWSNGCECPPGSWCEDSVCVTPTPTPTPTLPSPPLPKEEWEMWVECWWVLVGYWEEWTLFCEDIWVVEEVLVCEEVCCEVTGECELECWWEYEWVPYLECWWEVIIFEIWEEYCEIFIDPLEIVTKIRGKIFPLGYATHLVTVDPTASSAVFDITWAEGDLDFVLYSPNGTRIDPSVAANDTDISYGETVVDKLHMAMYVIYQNIEPGDWTMEITAIDVPSNGVNYYAIAYQISNLTLTLSTDKDKYNQSEHINIRADLRDNSTPLTGALVTVEIQRQDGTVDNIPLFDDGSHGDIQPDDGTYSNTYTNTTVGGQYNLIVHSSGTIDGYPFTRTISKLIAVEMQKVKFTNIYSDYGTDTDGDELYNYLAVDTGINVNSAGNYTLVGDLYDINGNEIASTYNHTYLDAGNQTISLLFDGLQIYKHGVDGPFNISYLALFDENDTLMCCRRDAYTTSAYNYTDFQALLVEFTSGYTDYGIDTDGDGLYEHLTIDVGVNVLAAGNYSLMGYLYDVNGTEIVWATNLTHLDIGNQTVQLNFDGKTIYKQGIDGPYYLKYLGIYDENRKQIARVLDAYATSAYNYTDFQAPLAVFTGDYTDYGIDFDGDGLYDYLTIDVGVNVITAGNYSLMGYLYDVNGTEIVWAIDYGSLDVGKYTMHLDFNGKTIQMHGVSGPYYLKHLILSLSGENWTRIDYIPDAYNTSAYNYSDFVDPVSTENEVTISGVGLGEIRLIVSFKDTIPVFSGRYSYDLVGINIPQRPNNFTITTSEVKNLKVGVKKIQDNTTRIWVTQTIAAPEGIATVQSDLPSPGNYHVKIFGDAAEGVSEVDLELTAVKKIKASGDFSLSIDISGFPAGKYTVTATADTGCFTDLKLDGLPLTP